MIDFIKDLIPEKWSTRAILIAIVAVAVVVTFWDALAG